MSLVLCPHCHVPLSPVELEEATMAATHYLVCPECDTPIMVVADCQPTGEISQSKNDPDA